MSKQIKKNNQRSNRGTAPDPVVPKGNFNNTLARLAALGDELMGEVSYDKEDTAEGKMFYRIDDGTRVGVPHLMLLEYFFNRIKQDKNLQKKYGITEVMFMTEDGYAFCDKLGLVDLDDNNKTVVFTYKKNKFTVNANCYIQQMERVNDLNLSSLEPSSMDYDDLFDFLMKISFEVSDLRGKSIEFYNMSQGWVKQNIPLKTFSDIYLPEHQMEDLQMYMEVFEEENILLRYLLVGAPGTCKTETMLVLANEANKRGITVMKTTIDEHMKDKAQVAKFLAPCILIFDDIDTSLGNRERGGGSPYLSYFLDMMDGTEKLPPNVGIIATTNSYDLLDIAAQRPGRFHKTILFDEITPENIKSIIKKSIKLEFSGNHDKLIDMLTDRMIISELAETRKTGSFIYNFVKMVILKSNRSKKKATIDSKWFLNELKQEISNEERIRRTTTMINNLKLSNTAIGFS